MGPIFLRDAAGTTEYRDKYSRYQAAYGRRLKAKYFSKKAFDGGQPPPPPLNFSSPDPIFYWLSSFCFVSPSASMGMIRDDVRASSCSPICGWLISGNIFDQETNVDGEIIKSGR